MINWKDCLVPASPLPDGYERPRKTNTLCWCCSNAYGGCSWSQCGKPVKGWRAFRRDISEGREGKRMIESYAVTQCPVFSLDKRFSKEYRLFSGKAVRTLAKNKRHSKNRRRKSRGQ